MVVILGRFFGQLALGIFADPIFLMTGKLHLPIPAVILADRFIASRDYSCPYFLSAPYYYPVPLGVASFVTSGLTHGDARGKLERKRFPYHKQMRYSILFLVMLGAILLRIFGASGRIATAFGIAVGVIGLLVMLLFSRKRRKMVHCSSYCPIGTLVSFLKYLSPFRVRLTTDCCHCMACTNACRYDALHKEEIEKGKIGYTCTYCGDCLSACKHGGYRISFPEIAPTTAERLWIVVTVVLHTCFLMIARI